MPSERPQILFISRAIVFADDERFLLIKRADEDHYYPGNWECPGGKLDAGQDVSSALEREVHEETGLTIEPVDEMVYLDSRVVADGAYAGLPYVEIFSLARVVGDGLSLSHEHSDAIWVTHKEALEYNLTPETRKALTALKDKITS